MQNTQEFTARWPLLAHCVVQTATLGGEDQDDINFMFTIGLGNAAAMAAAEAELPTLTAAEIAAAQECENGQRLPASPALCAALTFMFD